MKRRLAAIIAADVVDPAIARHHGRIVKLMGDGLLVEFASAVDAVSTAVEVQQAMPGWNGDRSEETRVTFRIGVNLGDVVIDGDDIQGDGVNVAARLEAMAAPGSVCVSDAVHDQVRDRLDLRFDNLGPQQMKNIDRPIQVWQWSDGATVKPLPEDVLPDLPDKPSIAVLPFDNMSGDPEQAYFADGISEDIITALSRSREMFVIARNSSFSYRGKSVDIRMVGKELGVRFVLEGSVRRAGNRVRITAQLIEAESGTHVWAERYDRPVDDIFEVQDEITINVAGAVGSEIRSADIRGVAGKRVEDLPSWERLMKAYWHIQRSNPQDNRIGQEICRAEIAATGGTAAFHSALVLASMLEVTWGLGGRAPIEVITDGMQAGRTAIELDFSDDAAHANIGLLLFVSGDHDGGLREGMTAIDLNPNSLWNQTAVGGVLGFAGVENRDAAMKHLNLAIRLGPRDLNIHWSYAFAAVFSLVAEKYDEAVVYARTAIRHNPINGTAHRVLAAALARDGQTDAAKVAWARAWEVQPVDLSGYTASLHRMFRHDEEADKFIEGMKLAGAPFD